jgi:hypothetical protein
MTQLPVPSYLEAGAAALRAIGFDAAAYAIDGFGGGMQQLRSQGIRVRVREDDTRLQWDSGVTNATPLTAAYGSGRILAKAPRGFEFNNKGGGMWGVSSALADAAATEFFVDLFECPRGPEGRGHRTAVLPEIDCFDC